ncbi:hypothetical protein Ctob_012283 [Chrysochromulina tobinii]|uniref:Uncharacterized protein n=1 Tax=Chrysochromulina tobinii TaxID=1460289 RepID=A0A0M0JW53_9EUKA|nr:hypothetical protein Ctob_012283 [Chrysochromulina tobinii]|eukprot:KOO30911.1 hypothetical protein Ctob_012283 [Chrysochromulina sp. CCMP291]
MADVARSAALRSVALDAAPARDTSAASSGAASVPDTAPDTVPDTAPETALARWMAAVPSCGGHVAPRECTTPRVVPPSEA